MSRTPSRLAFSPLPRFEPGFIFQPRLAWIDRFRLAASPFTISTRSSDNLLSRLRSASQEIPGLKAKQTRNSLLLEISSSHWLTTGIMRFSRNIDQLGNRISFSIDLNFNLMRFLAHRRLKENWERLPAQELLARIPNEDVRLHRLRRASLSVGNGRQGDDNYLVTPLEYEKIGQSRNEALSSYLSASNDFLNWLLLPVRARTQFRQTNCFKDWKLSEIEYLWEFQERDAIGRSQDIGLQLRRSAPIARQTYFTMDDGEQTSATTVPLVDPGNVEFVVYPKTNKRLRVEVRYRNGIRQRVGSTKVSLSRFPRNDTKDLVKFIDRVAFDAAPRANQLIQETLTDPEGGSLPSIRDFANAIAEITAIIGGDRRATQLVIKSLLKSGSVNARIAYIAPHLSDLESMGILRRYRPRQRNSEIRYVLVDRYKHLFSQARQAFDR